MNFEFSDDQQMLRDEARKFLAAKCPAEEVHRILNSADEYSQDVWDAIIEMGWTATALPEEYGGFGMGYLELCILAQEIGRASAPIPFSTAVYLSGETLLLAGSDAQKAELLPKLATGEAIGTLALAEIQHSSTTDLMMTSVTNGMLSGTKIVVPDGQTVHFAIVTAKEKKGASLFIANLSENGVSRTPVKTIDPTRSHSTIEFRDVPVEPVGKAGTGLEIIGQVFNRAAVLMAFEQLGGAEAALDLGRGFAIERFAFGRPIGSFQSIKHRLAEMYVSIELARGNCYHGAYALSKNADDLPIAAAAARIAAGQAFDYCARESAQVHGGIGFSWEANCHLYYRRAKLLSLAIGGERVWKDKLIGRLKARHEANIKTLSAA